MVGVWQDHGRLFVCLAALLLFFSNRRDLSRSLLDEGQQLEKHGEAWEWNQGHAEENQKGCWAAMWNQMTSANTSLLWAYTAWIVTFLASQRWPEVGTE